MIQTSHSKKEILDFLGRIDGIRTIWHHTDDDDAAATNDIVCDILEEIDNFFDIPFGN